MNSSDPYERMNLVRTLLQQTIQATNNSSSSKVAEAYQQLHSLSKQIQVLQKNSEKYVRQKKKIEMLKVKVRGDPDQALTFMEQKLAKLRLKNNQLEQELGLIKEDQKEFLFYFNLILKQQSLKEAIELGGSPGELLYRIIKGLIKQQQPDHLNSKLAIYQQIIQQRLCALDLSQNQLQKVEKDSDFINRELYLKKCRQLKQCQQTVTKLSRLHDFLRLIVDRSVQDIYAYLQENANNLTLVKLKHAQSLPPFLLQHFLSQSRKDKNLTLGRVQELLKLLSQQREEDAVFMKILRRVHQTFYSLKTQFDKRQNRFILLLQKIDKGSGEQQQPSQQSQQKLKQLQESQHKNGQLQNKLKKYEQILKSYMERYKALQQQLNEERDLNATLQLKLQEMGVDLDQINI